MDDRFSAAGRCPRLDKKRCTFEASCMKVLEYGHGGNLMLEGDGHVYTAHVPVPATIQGRCACVHDAAITERQRRESKLMKAKEKHVPRGDGLQTNSISPLSLQYHPPHKKQALFSRHVRMEPTAPSNPYNTVH